MKQEDAQVQAADAGRGLSDGLGPLPLWRDDAGRSWWGADELTGEQLLAWRDAAVAAEREHCAGIVRNAAHHGLCCSDYAALADMVAGIGA